MGEKKQAKNLFLQNSFKKQVGVSPEEYLRRLQEGHMP